MAHIYRALRALCAILCLYVLGVVPAHAFPYPYEGGKEWRVDNTYTPTWRATKQAACEDFGLYRYPTGAYVVRFLSPQCGVSDSPDGSVYDSPFVSRTPSSLCPANSSDTGTECQCGVGYTYEAGACVVPPVTCPAAGTGAGDGRLTLTSAQRAVLNSNGGYYYWKDEDGCVVRTSMDLCTTGDNGVTWNCVGKETHTGESYSGAPGDGSGSGAPSSTSPTTPPAGEENQPTTCPTGQCPGTVNGVNVCKPCSGTSTKKDKVEEKQNPDGTKEKKETSSKTTCTGKTCTTESTTTTTNRDASGTVTGTSSTTTTSTEDKGDYCQRNPNEPQCDDTGSFSGSCSAGFTCKGDAATCALAQEVHKRNCELNATTAASGLYDVAKDATGNVTGDNPNNSTFSVGPGSFNTTDAIGGAQCVQDLNVTVWGSALSLPLSSICGPLGYIGNVLVMVSLLLAARIVTRG